ncbi:MAG: hypothetical protein JST53_02180 [Actinobacteria bacterium]|nr:hypothetical protein [Actinomycetota bacterium]
MSKTLRNESLGAAAILVAVGSFASVLYVVLTDGLAPVGLLVAALAALAMPVVLVGLAFEQRPGFSSWGQAGALVYAVGSVGLAFVALYALVAGVHDVDALRSDLGDLIPAAQAALVPGGIAFAGAAYVRNQLPRWSSACFGLGLVLMLLTLDGPAGFALAAEGLRDLGLLGMGLALLPVHSNHPGRVAPGV